MNRIWKVKSPNPELSATLAESLKISHITAQLLINRGITDEMQANHFLYGDLAGTHDPFRLKDMEKAVARIKRAIASGEKILVHGDYDVDGITAAALLKIVLSDLKADIEAYIPNRLDEGYGLSEKCIKVAHHKKISLIITVDCGISAHKEVAIASKLGMDVIITDHHEIKSETLPAAYAIINPFQKNCDYPFKYLSGVGLAYKLAKALTVETGYPIDEHLDLVALGTVSDMSAQSGENRILTKYGLKELNKTKKIGIKALMEVSGLKGKSISCRHIGYVLGPRINAMGRIGSPEVALKLILSTDADEAKTLAETLDKENRNRQKIEASVTEEAMDKIEKEINFKDTNVIVLSNPNWHMGVIGIVASRVVEKFYRPAIVISVDGERGKGSGRSIDNFHLFNAINECSEYLIDFGGHEGACGLAIEKKNIENFRKKINEVAKSMIVEKDLYPTVNIDMEVPLSDLSEKLVDELALLVPFGPENPKPVLSSKNVSLKQEPRRIAKNGIKMWVTASGITCEAISFKMAGLSLPSKGSRINLAYSPSINTWQGVSSVQLDLKDLKLV